MGIEAKIFWGPWKEWAQTLARSTLEVLYNIINIIKCWIRRLHNWLWKLFWQRCWNTTDRHRTKHTLARTSKPHPTTQDAIEKYIISQMSKSHTNHPTQNRQHETSCLAVMEDTTQKTLRFVSICQVLLECAWYLLVNNWMAVGEVKGRIMWWRIADHGVEGAMILTLFVVLVLLLGTWCVLCCWKQGDSGWWHDYF